MIRHMLFFRFKPEATYEERSQLLFELSQLPRQFPGIAAFELARNVSERDSEFDHGMTMTFDDMADLNTYLRSERHENLVTTKFRPIIDKRSIVSMEV